ncbi:hypothetical protein D4764_07G0009790 [Takifugu flavidus]|uniref:Glutathione hydrolase 5 proenzyme n=1 Tax=Takifugu flavidus TaxID=433684 RepID=A0A5C6MXX5_9TELE|nr:hypothetical protein D4764_07G0009790 [Takifugu flavidus]
MEADLTFSSRRSPVVSLHGCVASSQPLASNIGLDILKRGGNAADAAVAIAAALAVTEPCSTGPGGDAFCLFYNGETGDIKGINGSGRSPRAQTLDFIEGLGYTAEAPPLPFDALNVTVPGAPACWCDTIQMFGSQKLSLQEVLSGAVELAEVGFPVAETLGEGGKSAFYKGRVAQAIVDVIRQHGGVMTLDDLSSHDSEVITPISTDYKGVRLWEPPPNSQGLAALLLLNILESFPLKALGHNSSDYIHILVEALRLTVTDSLSYLGDPEHVTIPLGTLLDKSYSQKRAQHISMDSNCMGFGTGLVPKDCGFSLQVLLNMLEFGMNPQQALDAPRIYVHYDQKTAQWMVHLEEGVRQEVAEELIKRGHKVNWPITGHKRSQFGRGQIITVGNWWSPSVSQTNHPSKVLWAGSDPRGDGCAQGY